MADWLEIKRLAADFHRTQTIETINRISERNCIDIIKKLNELNYIETIYTCDGKEIVTQEQLLKETEDEVYKNCGRIHLHELAARLNVDYQHVEKTAHQLLKTNSDYQLILGQLIHIIYKDALSKRVNHTLVIDGQLSISEFAKNLDLPSDYLLSLLDNILKNISDDVVVSQDGQTVYTANTMDTYKSIIRGTLTAIFKPTTIASLLKRLDMPERILLPIVEALIKEGRIDGSVENRQFIPASYARQQNEYINKFYAANSYIEYDVISRMDIKQPKIFLKKKFPDGVQLKTCLVSSLMITQVESMLEETVATNSWIDISTIIPSSIEPKDIDEMLAIIFKKFKDLQSACLIFDDTYVCSRGYIDFCKRLFEPLMPAKAAEDLKSGKLIAHFMVTNESTKDVLVVSSSDDDEAINKRVKGKKGHTGQGREVKNKNVKKKYFVSTRGPNKKGSQSQGQVVPEGLRLQEAEEMKAIIQKQTSDDCSDEFLLSIVKMIEVEVNKSYATVARQVFDDFIKAQEEEKENDGDNPDLNTEERSETRLCANETETILQ